MRVVVMVLALALSLSARAHAEPRAGDAVTHGREIGVHLVGPAAGGYNTRPARLFAAGGEIRDGKIPDYARLISTGATYDGIPVSGPHLLIENVTIQTSLDIYTPLAVVLRGVHVAPAGGPWAIHTRPGSGPLYVLWSQVGGSAGPSLQVETALLLRGGAARVTRSHITLSGDAIHADAPDIHIEENLIDGLIAKDGSHNDAIQIAPGVEDVVIRRNRILNQNPQTSCIFNEGSSITIEDNYLAGGGWVIYGGAKGNGHRKDGRGAAKVNVAGNVFGADFFPKSGHFGTVAYWNAASNNWSGNTNANGQAVRP